MTVYAGETIQIRVEATEFGVSTVLTDDDIDTMFVTIFDSSGDAVLDQTEIDYDSEVGAWIYNWHTTDIDPGTYKAKVEATGPAPDETYSLEFKRLRIARRPVGD